MQLTLSYEDKDWPPSSAAAAPCVRTLRALTRNLLTYLLTCAFSKCCSFI